MSSCWHLPRSTGTHGDVFAAVGLAELLASIPGVEVYLREEREGFAVSSSRRLSPSELKRVPQIPGYPFLKANEKVKVPVGAVQVVDYKAEQAKVERFRQAHASRGKAVDEELLQVDQPREDWHLLQVLYTLQGYSTSNRVYQEIVRQEPAEFRDAVVAGVRGIRKGEPSGVRWNARAVQLFTPTAAKGYSRLKPNSTGRSDSTKEQWTDPFLEWLKYRGYFAVACPYFQGSKGEDVRILCPVPRDIPLGALKRVARELRRKGVYGNSPKVDILVALRLAELVVRHSEEYHAPGVEVFPGLFLSDRTPAEAISGITVTHYQSMGTARAVTAMAILALPGWFPIHTREDATQWLETLDEHQKVIRGLEERHSDEVGLILAYRRFLQRRGETATWALIEFMEVYGSFLIRAREQRRKVRPFRTDRFRRIVMETAPKLTEILEDPGFQAVAAAVRKATVSAQAQKAMGKSDYREIRYDLLHELRRKRSLPGVQPLVEAVSDFVSRYNAENARRREMKKRAPRNVTTEEFHALVALIQKHGASTVGALLCAYGSCREPRDEEEAESAEAAAEETPVA